MKRPTLIIMTFALAALLFIPPVAADAESERANLARMVGELDHLLRSVDRYRIDAAQGRRYTFDYAALSGDIAAMRKGIEEYIDKDLSLAREIPPLSTQYVQQPQSQKQGQ